MKQNIIYLPSVKGGQSTRQLELDTKIGLTQ